MTTTNRIPWSSGVWTTEPISASVDGDDLLVHAAHGSDAWRHTSYGFVHDTEHALLTPFSPGTGFEVTFTLDFEGQFDQAGVFVRGGEDDWIKAGVEFSDGQPQLGAVVTHRTSDWSLAPVPRWVGRRVTIRASRSGDAITFRARTEEDDWRMFRLAHVDASAVLSAGPMCCSPASDDLTVRFHSWVATEADVALH